MRTLFVALLACASSQVFAFDVNPFLSALGQELRITCKATDSEACLALCGESSECRIEEPSCRSCAGTQNLWMKRVLDQVGLSLRARGAPISDAQFLELLKVGSWISLHEKSLYNYSSVFNGALIKEQFDRACAEVGGVDGILLIKTHPVTHVPEEIMGMICSEALTHDAHLYLFPESENRLSAIYKRRPLPASSDRR